tara:strand:+ start:4970 stop:5542 length:573 start_codon:yes stop_codon:yes gene_type:complete
MKKFNLIIHQNQYLYEILKEINLDLHYQLILANDNIDEILNKLKIENKEFLIISNNIKNGYDNKRVLLINKPIKIFELTEKISLLFLKNKYSLTSNISIGDYKINLNSRYISLDNTNLKLTEKELELIMYLYNTKVERKSSDIRRDVWGHSENVETHTVETHIYRLRKKIIDKFKDDKFLLYNNDGYIIK